MILLPSRKRLAFAGSALIVAIVCADLSAWASDADSIGWRDDYGSALQEAKIANRPLWIQFTGPWCPNCARMERDSFPHPEVVQHARESFVPLKLRSDVHEQLALDFNLSGLPATIIVAPNREVVAVHQGYLGPEEFNAFLRDSLSRVAGAPASRGRATDRPDSPARAGRGSTDLKNMQQLALGGYCPVSLICDRKLVAGQTEYSLRHDGQTYRFASLATRERFREKPDLYVPANNGSCPVTRLDRGKDQPGDPRWGILYEGRLFLFASERDRLRFLKEPLRYAMVDVAEEGFCVHCIRESGLLVRGDPRHEVAREGRRYWFPDASHRIAFLASPR